MKKEKIVSLNKNEGYIEEDNLSETELQRLEYLGEHPELADPIIWFIPEKKQ